jgi:hypothetical protein
MKSHTKNPTMEPSFQHPRAHPSLLLLGLQLLSQVPFSLVEGYHVLPYIDVYNYCYPHT